jgi:hypothetical protein
MKTLAVMISTLLVLLSAGLAQSQSMRQGQPSGVRGRATTARPSIGVAQPGFAQQPRFVAPSGFVNQPRFAASSRFAQSPGFVHGFNRQQFFAHSSAFHRSNRFPFRSGFVGGPILFVGPRTMIAPWPYWYAYPPTAYAPTQYWAYCQSPEGYYPYVQDCPGGWLSVVPTPPAPEWWQSSPDPGPSPMGGSSSEEIREQIARSQAETGGRLEVSLETATGSRRRP